MSEPASNPRACAVCGGKVRCRRWNGVSAKERDDEIDTACWYDVVYGV